MTYSSALFEEHTPDLAAAQNNKYHRLAEAIDLQPGQKLLEIGCGWGGFAEYAAKTFGARVVGLTISKEQRDFAQAANPQRRACRQRRNPAAGLPRRARPL